MGLFNNKKSNKEPSIVRRVSDYFGGILTMGTEIAPALNAETALESTAVLNAVRTIAEGIASVPFNLTEEKTVSGRVKRVTVKNHWAHKLINQKPNSWQTPFEFIEQIMVNLLLSKGALILKVQVGKEIKELIPVPGGAYTVETMSDYSVNYRVQYSDGSQQVFNQSQVIYIHGLSLDRIYWRFCY